MKLTALACAVLFSVVCFAAAPTLGEPFHTENAATDIHLESGVAVHLAARSTGTIFTDHAILNEGAARISNFNGYPVEAHGLQIESETPNAQAVIRFQKDTVEVASIGGALNVSAGGALLTRVTSGTRMSFQNTGATIGPPSGKRRWSETKTWVCVIVGISATALAIGLTAAAQGKSPF